MLNKLKWYAYYSIALAFSIALAGSGIYVLWLEFSHSAALESLNAFTVESWNAMTNSPHQHATVMDMAITGAILLACTAVLISPILGGWVLLIWLDSRGSQNSQVEGGCEDTRNEKPD